MMNRIRVPMFVLAQWITCIAVALLSTGCISFNLGAKLDTIGKAVPEAHDFQYYMLDGKRYVECEVRYQSLDISVIGGQFGHMCTHDEYGELPRDMKTPQPTRYVLAMDDNEVIASEHFDYTRAIRIDSPEGIQHFVPEQYLPHYRPLSADKAELMNFNEPVNFVPEVRTVGNYARTPLVALVSYGVDIPLTLAGNITLYTLLGAGALIYSVPILLVESLM